MLAAPAAHTEDNDIDFNLTLAIGNGYAVSGNPSSAKLMYERALAKWPTASETSRAWAYQNLAMAHFELRQPMDGCKAFEDAARLRAAAGVRDEPARTLSFCGNRMERFNPAVALTYYDQALNAIRSAGKPHPRAEGALEFARARLLLDEMREPRRALEALETAAALLKPILEEEETYASVLMWKAHCLSSLGDSDGAARVHAEHQAFAADAGELRQARVEALLAGGTPAADGPERERVIEAYAKASALLKTDLPQALDLLQQAVSLEGSARKADSHLQGLLLSTGAWALWGNGQADDAIRWQRSACDHSPGSSSLRTTLAAFLLGAQRLADCSSEAKRIIEDFPWRRDGYLYAGISAHRGGSFADAVVNLEAAKARGARGVDALLDDARSKIEPTAAIVVRGQAAMPPVTHLQFLELLRLAAKRIERNSEVFWASRQRREFRESPEAIGKALLVQDLSRDPAHRLYNEVQLPGGRMDVTVNVYGTEYVIELKMCGGRYPKAYAELGFGQLEGYMKMRAASRAYLLIFDGRVTQSGAAAIPAEHELSEGRRIFCVNCNVLGLEAR